MKKLMRLIIFTAAVALIVCDRSVAAQDLNGAPSEVGVASWYGYPFHGRTTASGEIYDMELITAAHRTLPLDSWARVTNLVNNKTVEVRITDRGPFIDGRVIDLSRAAARAIDIIDSGIAQVRIDPVAGPALASIEGRFTAVGRHFTVQAGAFHEKANAERLMARLARTHPSVRMVERAGDPAIWRVLVGSESTRANAAELAEALGGFVVVEADELPTMTTDASAQLGND